MELATQGLKQIRLSPWVALTVWGGGEIGRRYIDLGRLKLIKCPQLPRRILSKCSGLDIAM